MLRIFAEKCTDILLRHGAIPEERKAVYIYGFELLWSLTLSSISILLVGWIFGYVSLAVTFLVYFIPIRIPAGGFHAGTYKQCFLITNFTAIICVCISSCLYPNIWTQYILWGMLLISTLYIWYGAPVISRKHPVKKDRIDKNRKYTRLVLILDLVGILFIKIVINSQIVSTAIVTLCAVAVMIFIAKKGGK